MSIFVASYFGSEIEEIDPIPVFRIKTYDLLNLVMFVIIIWVNERK